MSVASSDHLPTRVPVPYDGSIAAAQEENSPELGHATGPRLTLAAALTCIVLVAIDLRPAIVSIGPLLPSIRDEFAISNALASLLTAIPALLMGLFAFPTPWLARRFGRDAVMLAALSLLAGSIVARAFAFDIASLFLTTAGVGVGIAVAGALISGFIKKNYPDRVALFTGIYASSIGLGSTIAAMLTGPLASATGGWRLSAGVFVVPAIIAVAAWLVVAHAERTTAKFRPGAPLPQPGSPLPVKAGAAWLAALYFSLNNILFFGVIAWLAPMFIEYGMKATDAAFLLASFTAAFMIANTLAGIASRSRDRRVVIGLFAGVSVIGILSLAIAPTIAPFAVVPAIAFGIGGSFTLGMVLPLDHASHANEANSWAAFVLGIGYAAGALGPVFLGLARDVTSGFVVPVWILVAVAVLKLAIVPVLRPAARSTEV